MNAFTDAMESEVIACVRVHLKNMRRCSFGLDNDRYKEHCARIDALSDEQITKLVMSTDTSYCCECGRTYHETTS